MAVEYPGKCITFPAAGDLSAAQYTFVTVPDSNGRVTTAGDGVNSIGIQQNKPAAIDRGTSIMIDGVSKLVVGTAVLVGAKIASDAAGKAITAASGKTVLATALVAGSAGDIISVELASHAVLA